MRYNYLGKIAKFSIKEFTKESIWTEDHSHQDKAKILTDYRYEYDRDTGFLKKVSNYKNHKFTLRDYNSKNLLVSETLETGLKVDYEYDFFGRKTKQILPDSSEVRYSYDAAYLKEVSRYNPKKKFQYAHKYLDYDLRGNCIKERMIHDCQEVDYTYDKRGLISSIESPTYNSFITKRDFLGNVIYVETKDVFTEGYYRGIHNYLFGEGQGKPL